MKYSADKIRTCLILGATAFLPFTWELVFDAGVPVKVYEVLFLAVIILSVYKKDLFRVLPEVPGWKYLLVFLALTGISGAASVRIIKGIPVPGWAVGRNHPYGSIALEYAYLLFDVLVMLVIVRFAREKHRLCRLIDVLTGVSILVCLYAFIQLAYYKLTGSAPALPTMPERKALFDFIIPRVTGVFKEPNYMAGFLVCIMPFSLAGLFGTGRRVRISAAALAVQCAGLYLTFSTVGWLVFTAVAAGMLAARYRTERRRVLIVAGCLAGAVLLLWLFEPRIYYEVIYDKLFGRFLNPNTISRVQRKQQLVNALMLTLKHPLLGVGLSNYGLVADHVFRLGSSFNLTVNSVFAEVLCETGLFGFTGQVLFLGSMGKRLYRRLRAGGSTHSPGVGGAFAALVCMLNAYPSHTLTFIWVLLGMTAAYLIQGQRDTSKSG